MLLSFSHPRVVEHEDDVGKFVQRKRRCDSWVIGRPLHFTPIPFLDSTRPLLHPVPLPENLPCSPESDEGKWIEELLALADNNDSVGIKTKLEQMTPDKWVPQIDANKKQPNEYKEVKFKLNN